MSFYKYYKKNERGISLPSSKEEANTRVGWFGIGRVEEKSEVKVEVWHSSTMNKKALT